MLVYGECRNFFSIDISQLDSLSMWVAKDPHRDIAGRIDDVQNTSVRLLIISKNIPNIEHFSTLLVTLWVMPRYDRLQRMILLFPP